MGRYRAAGEVSYAERKRACVCWETLGRNRSAVLLADFLFPAVQQCIVSLPHTHTHIPKALLFFIFFAVPSVSPTLSQINLCPLISLPALNPPLRLTHTALALVAMKYFLFFLLFLKFPPLYSFHMGTEPDRALSNAYFCVYDGRVKRVVGCLHQIIGESIKINHITNKPRRDR